MALSDSACRNAKADGKQKKLSDGGGMYLLVLPTGGKSWRLGYRFDGKQKAISLGPYPAVSLAEARAKREAAKKLLAAGKDPNIKSEPAQSDTFESFARRWHDNEKGGWVQAHAERVLSRMERDVFPEIGAKAITAIEAPDILALLRKVEDRGALDISKRLRQSIGAVFRFAIAEGKAKHNPAADVGDALKPKPKVKHFASLKAGEIPDLLARIDAYDGEAQTRLALLLTLHTFVRTSEARFAAWPEFEDLDGPAPLWRIPGSRMKMGREHLVPLTPQVVDILRELRALNGGHYLFPGAGGRGVMSQNTMIFALYRMGYHSKLTVHGFRSMASTILNEAHFNRDWIERQLAHAEDDEVRGAYNAAEWLPGRREMMKWWSDYLTTARPSNG
ncbi:MAG TPA: integrase arm-type DNA-binding domain-containing protein [Fluviicoccus sp.]|nr:integrase arm-type DNA-binding domain-containing protein [Fluviicoccus sp.]